MSESERITYRDYWQQVASVADDVAEEMREAAYDDVSDLLWQRVDSHQWIIYYHHNLAVMEHTDNGAALMDEMGADGLTGADSWHEVCTRFAFYAFLSDVEASFLARFTEAGRPIIKMKDGAS